MFKVICTHKDDGGKVYETEFTCLEDACDKVTSEMENDLTYGGRYNYKLYEKSDWAEISFRAEFRLTWLEA